jgi:hypothetical protein
MLSKEPSAGKQQLQATHNDLDTAEIVVLNSAWA